MKLISISIVLVALFISGSMILLGNKSTESVGSRNNVSIGDGKQIISIKAKGGYSPSSTIATANTPTVLKVTTGGTFDCSSAITIPAIGYQEYLKASGETLIDIPAQAPGTTLQGLCSMGMYNFSITFE
jgi:plastocyanin domain-containing protein